LYFITFASMMINIRLISLFLLSLSCMMSISLQAQKNSIADLVDLPLRIEIPAQSANETYRIIPTGKSGLILYYRSREMADEASINWYFARYDTNLLQVWVKPIPLPVDHNILDYKYESDTLALLFVPVGKTKISDNRFELIRISPASGVLMLNAGQTETPAVIKEFSIRHGVAWLGVNQKGLAGSILTIQLNEGKIKNFPLGIGSSLTVLALKADIASPTVTCVVSRQIAKKVTEYFFVRYDTAGKLKMEIMLGSQTDDWSLSNVQITEINNGTSLLTGSYLMGVHDSQQKTEQFPEATGLFSCVVDETKKPQMGFYNFLEFKNAESFIGEKDILDLKKKALKKKKELNEYSLDFQLVAHDLLSVNGQFISVSEVFSPQYRSETFTDFDFYGRPYTNSYSVFDGYRYSNAIVAGFNPEGKLLWDNNLELRNLTSMELAEKVVVFPTDNNFVLFYMNEGILASKIIHENGIVEKTDYTPIDLMYPEDKLISETKGKVDKWYGNYFIASGFQEIKNIAKETDNKRLVFFFSKLIFEP
jgi:hypothetical protein